MNMLCNPQEGGVMDNCLIGQVKGGDGGQMIYACSKGMCFSWPGAHSQHWRWMPGGESWGTKRAQGREKGKGPGVHSAPGVFLVKTRTWGLLWMIVAFSII